MVAASFAAVDGRQTRFDTLLQRARRAHARPNAPCRPCPARLPNRVETAPGNPDQLMPHAIGLVVPGQQGRQIGEGQAVEDQANALLPVLAARVGILLRSLRTELSASRRQSA